MDDPILGDVKRLVAETCAVDIATVRDEGRLIEYGLDSVRATDLIISLEERFRIRIADEDAAKMKTVADVARYVRDRAR